MILGAILITSYQEKKMNKKEERFAIIGRKGLSTEISARVNGTRKGIRESKTKESFQFPTSIWQPLIRQQQCFQPIFFLSSAMTITFLLDGIYCQTRHTKRKPIVNIYPLLIATIFASLEVCQKHSYYNLLCF